MAKWTTCFVGSSLQLESCYSLDGNSKKIGDIVDALNAGEEAKAEMDRLKAELVQVRENERFLKSCNNGQAKLISDLQTELAKAKDEADARVAATIATAEEWYGRRIPELDQYRPKPRFVWTECKDSFGNTYWACNDNRTVTCHLRNNRVMWWAACPDPLVFDTADLAKAAVERYLTEVKR